MARKIWYEFVLLHDRLCLALWVDTCRPLYGGMDMFALDVLHCKDGSEYILEINDYAMGFDYAFETEDVKHVR